MCKQKWRRICNAALLQAGYGEFQLFFERNGRAYTSYWGHGNQRAEVIVDKRTGTVSIFELAFVS